MAHKQSFGLTFALILIASFGASRSGSAVTPGSHALGSELSSGAPASRLSGDWRTSPLVRIPGSTPRASRLALAEAAAPPSARLERVVLLLSSSTAQQKALTVALADLHDPSSPHYHQWLTPASFARDYANSASDVSALSDWLESEGLEVAPAPTGRGWIEFSGTVADVEHAFHTRIAAQTTSAGTRFLLADTISVPGALAPLVLGLSSLDGVVSEPALTSPEPVAVPASELASQSLPAAPALSPQLVAQLLHLAPLHATGIQGTGQTIAIAARSNVNLADFAAFRSAFGLDASTLKILPAGPDPGRTADQAEATLSASWAAAAAPAARIVLVPATTTDATDGIDLSLAAIIDRQLASTVAIGYSACEASLSPAHQALYAALYRQAAAEGISVVAAAGDSGPSACRLAGDASPVSAGYGVNGLASTPWNTSIGAAAFDSPTVAHQSTSLSAWSPARAAGPSYASGGGSSALYSAPSWQPIPAQAQQQLPQQAVHNRLLPDLALPTALDSSLSPGLAYCFSGLEPATSCALVRSGGSSPAAALFAGIAALVDQKYGPQGNVAPRLYALSRQAGIFTDVDHGSAQLPCAAGSPGCGPDSLIGYSAVPGFDLATGLGVVDAQSLVARWASPDATGTAAASVNLSVSPTELNSTYNPSASITLAANVISETGGATPTGTVIFVDSSEMQPISSAVAVNSSGVATVTVEGVFGVGGNEIFASYSGDSTYASATSSPDLNINIQPSTTSLAVVPSATSVTPGQTITATVTLTVGSPPEGSVSPTGVVTMDVDGLPTATAPLATTAGVTTATFSIVIPASSTLATHALQAVYAGNLNYNASTSPAISVTVAKASTTTTVTPATTTPAAGSSLVVNASVVASGSGSTAPTGTITFLLDSVSQGIVPVTSGTTTSASYTIPDITAGTHILQATYSGDGNYAASTSTPVTLTAAKGATTTTVTATPPILAAGTAETLTATVTPLNAVTGTVYTITGTVNFYDGDTTLLGTAPLSSTGVASLTGVALANTVSHSITAIYSGDPNWLASQSVALPLAATTLPDNVVLTSNLSAVNPGQALVLTATVTPSATPALGAEQNPTGNVIFYDGTTVIGTVALSASAIGDTSTAALTIQTLPGGQDVLSAYYVGDLYFDAETSNLLTLDILGFTITPSPSNPATNLNIVQGTSGSASYLVSGLGGFNNTVQVVCAVPTQDDMTCTASPQDVTPPTSITFVVQTFLPGQQTTTTTASRRTPTIWPRAASGTALALLAVFLLPYGKRVRIFAHRSRRTFFVLVLLLVGLAGAGIGCTNVSGVNGTGTPLGVATLKITASANVDNTVVSQSIYLTVNVIPPTSTQ